MRLTFEEIAEFRRLLIQKRASPPKIKPLHERFWSFVAAMCVVLGVSACAIFFERAFESPVIVAAMWAAPVSFLTRSLSHAIGGVILVALAYAVSADPIGLRSPQEILVFLLMGFTIFLSIGIVFRGYISDKRSLARERDVYRSAYADFERLAQDSESAFVWIDTSNSWISCNQAALTSIGIARVNSIFDLTQHEEHDVILQLMHSGSRSGWQSVVDAIEIERKRTQTDGSMQGMEPKSLQVEDVCFVDANASPALYRVHVILTAAGDAMIQGTAQRQLLDIKNEPIDPDLVYITFRRLPSLAVSRGGRVLAASKSAIDIIGFDPKDFHLGDIEGFSGTDGFESEFLKLIDIEAEEGRAVIVESTSVHFNDRPCAYDTWLNSGNVAFTTLVLPFAHNLADLSRD